MKVAGIDVGSRTAATVILEEGNILSYSIIPTGADSAKTATLVMEEALKGADISLGDIKYIVATGYGRIIVPFASEKITEIACHARGAHWYFPTVQTVLDMGGQDCKAIRVNDEGKHTDFAMNDKCAAGTGRFLEIMAQVLRLPLNEIGELSLQSKNEVRISSTCAVFAKAEVASLMRRGVDKKDILAGLHEAVSVRVFLLLRTVGIEKDFVITGGIAKNIGVVRKVEEKVGLKALIPEEPQIVGALGAALFARERCSGKALFLGYAI